MIAPPDTTIDVNGVTLAVDDRNATAPGTPLVLVHGFTGGRVDWADVIDELATDRRVIAWDHRGHADSTNTGDAAGYTFGQLAADTAAVVDHLGLDRFDLLGHSMGGIVSMTYVLAHPERVRSLVLMDTGAEPMQVIPEAWISSIVAKGRTEGMGAVADLMARFAEGQDNVPVEARPRVIARVRHKLEHMDVEAFEALGLHLRSFDPLLARLSELTCPVTVLVGENDTGLRPASDAIHAAIPQSELVVVPDAAHCPQEDNPSVWLAAMRAHLERAASA